MSAIAVTGASAGVGRATVERFARRGARIGLLAREPDRLEAAAAEVERLGGEALVLPLDVADHDAVDEAASTIEERFGPLDEQLEGEREGNLFEPVPGDVGAHGRFCDRAKGRSLLSRPQAPPARSLVT